MTPTILCLIETLGLGGGAERLLVSLLPRLRERGLRVEVATLWRHGGPELDGELAAREIPLHRLDLPHRWAVPQALHRLAGLQRRRQFDWVWGHLYFGNLYALLTCRRFPALQAAVTLHSPGYHHHPPQRPWHRFRMRLEDHLVRRHARAVVAVSGPVAEDYRQALGWPDVRVIPNGVDLAAAPPPLAPAERERLRRRWGDEGDDFNLLIPARLHAQKGHDVLLEALDRLAAQGFRPRLLCVGQGPLREALRDRIEALGLGDRVQLLGALPQPELFRLMQAADAVVMPSRREPFGMAAAEAMLLGTPAVLSRVDGLAEVGGEAAALMVPPGDAGALAQAIGRLKREAGLAERLAQAARERVADRFDIEKAADQWAELFQTVAKARGPH